MYGIHFLEIQNSQQTSHPGSGRENNSDRNSNPSLSSPSSTPSLGPTLPMQPRVGGRGFIKRECRKLISFNSAHSTGKLNWGNGT